MNRTLAALLVAAGVAAGTIVGASISLATTPANTKTVNVEVVPAECREALSYAEQVITYASQGFGIASDAMDAMSNFDISGINEATVRLTTVGDKVDAVTPSYQSAKSACLNS